MCHVTKYSTIRGVFQQPWPGVSPTAIFNEEKALGTRLAPSLTGSVVDYSFHPFALAIICSLLHFFIVTWCWFIRLFVHFPGWGVLPSITYIGMCSAKGYGFLAFLV